MDVTGRSLRAYGICAVGYVSDESSQLLDFLPPVPLAKTHVQNSGDL